MMLPPLAMSLCEDDMTTTHMVGAIVIGSLLLLLAIDRGFKGVKVSLS